MSEPVELDLSDGIEIDPDDLTLNELAEFEKLSGSKMSQLGEGNFDAQTMIALVYIVLRKDHPGLTIEQVGELKLGAINVGRDNPLELAE